MTAAGDFPRALIEALEAVATAQAAGGRASAALSLAIGMLSALPATSAVGSFATLQRHAGLLAPLPAHQKPASDQAPPDYAGMIGEEPNLQYLFLFHQDGHARQAGLDAITMPPSGAFWLAAILPRLNDWVPEVRLAASNCLRRIAPMAAPDMLLQALLAVFINARNWARWGDNGFLVVDMLQHPRIVQHLVDYLKADNSGPVCRLMRLVLRQQGIDDHLLDLARTAALASVRARALRVLLDGKAEWEEIPPIVSQWRLPPKPVAKSRALSVASPPVSELIALGLADRAALVRKVAARAVVVHAHNLPDLPAIIELLLADPTAAIRWRGDFLSRTTRSVAGRSEGLVSGAQQLPSEP